MRCSESQQRMQDLLDERLRPEEDASLVEHATACQSCGEMLIAQERLLDALRRTGPPSLPGDFAERVVDTAVTPRRVWSFGPWLAATALAASLLLILLPALRSSRRSDLAVESRQRLLQVSPAQTTGIADPAEIDSEQYRALIQGLILQMHRLPQLQQVDQIAGSIRPLATTLNAAIDMLWRSTLSGGWESRSSDDSAGVLGTRRVT